MIDFHCTSICTLIPRKVVARCRDHRLTFCRLQTVPSAFQHTAALAPAGGCIKTALGLHPELVTTRYHELALFETLLSQTAFVGESRVDGSTQHRLTLSHQEAVLKEILRLCAKVGGRILSLHSRGAAKNVLDVLGDEPNAGTFVLHWFIANKRQVQRAVRVRMLVLSKSCDVF